MIQFNPDSHKGWYFASDNVSLINTETTEDGRHKAVIEFKHSGTDAASKVWSHFDTLEEAIARCDHWAEQINNPGGLDWAG